MPRAWHEQCFVLQVASKVWWDYHRSPDTPAAHTLTYFRLQTVDSVSGNIRKLTGSGWQLVLNTRINIIAILEFLLPFGQRERPKNRS